jgi:hypothetical protein
MSDIDAVAGAIRDALNEVVFGESNEEAWRRLAQAAIDALRLAPEFGWDVAGRQKPNPERIYGGDGRPVTSQPNPSDYPRLYKRLTSPWVRIEEQP